MKQNENIEIFALFEERQELGIVELDASHI
jgi:hypothetical protein